VNPFPYTEPGLFTREVYGSAVPWLGIANVTGQDAIVNLFPSHVEPHGSVEPTLKVSARAAGYMASGKGVCRPILWRGALFGDRGSVSLPRLWL
jgi:hypothetical protein